MSDVETRPCDDPYYEIHHDGHVISGEGIYCPGESVYYDPPEDLRRGDDCPVCNNELDC
jgi:hypothetical protein